MSAPIVIIAGTPGAGKSSVAAALLGRFARGLHLPIDDLRERVVVGMAHPVPEWSPETSRQFWLARQAAALTAALYAAEGFAVAIDDVIAPAEARDLLEEPLARFPVHTVLLRPSLAATLGRNAARTNKPFDTGALTATIRRLYDTTDPAEYAAYGWQIVDSTALTVEQTVDTILAEMLLKTPPPTPPLPGEGR